MESLIAPVARSLTITSFTLRACICALALAGTPAIAAESYTLDPSHTSVLYALNHLSFSTSRGIFRDVTGQLVLDENTPSASRLEVTIKTASIDCFDASRDKAVRGAQFLDVEHFPEMRFVSTTVERTGETTAKVTGELTSWCDAPGDARCDTGQGRQASITGAQRLGFCKGRRQAK